MGTKQREEKPKKEKLTQGSVHGHLVRTTVPVIWGILAVMSKNLVDTFFVAKLGTDQLSAMSFGFPIVLTVLSLCIGLGAGAASLVSRALGRDAQEDGRRYATDSLLLALLMMTTLAFLGAWVSPSLFGAMGAKGAVLPHVLAFMQIWWLGLPALALMIGSNAILRSTGDTLTPSVLMIISAVLNVLLDPLLIFGMWGLPRLGIAGAAWATLLSNVVVALLMLYMLACSKKLLSFEWVALKTLVLSWRDVLVIGLPAAVSNAINPFGISLLTVLLAHYGKESVAGYGVGSRIESFGVIGMLALSASIGAIVGQNFGARKMSRIREAIRLSYVFCAVYGVLLAGLIAVTAPWVVPLFDQHAEVQRVAKLYLWMVPISLMGYGFSIVAAAALNAVGRSVISSSLTFARMLLFTLPLAWGLSHVFQVKGVFIAAIIGNVLGGGLSIAVTTWMFRMTPEEIKELGLHDQEEDAAATVKASEGVEA